MIKGKYFKKENEMDLNELKYEQDKIEEYVDRFYDKNDIHSEPILDGIVNEEKYLQSKYKIAWVLKEPYDEDDGTGGGWSLTKDILNQEELYPKVVGRSPTWQPMVYVTYSLLNNFLKYKDMEYIRDMPEMAQCLNQIALVNINKMPGFHRSNDDDIYEKYQNWKHILHWQLKIYNPQIVIFGNTFQFFSKDIGITDTEMKHGDCLDWILKDNKLFISAYHPAQTQISRDRYVQGIVDIVQKNMN
jgi:hypothetical protein